jgi:uncharacterized protein YndB with AHSA1/START domain
MTQRLGTHEPLGDGRHRLRFERHLRHPVERVWRALTDPGELEAWLARSARPPVAGGPIDLEWFYTDEDGNRYEGAELSGTVSRMEPPHLIEWDSDVHGLLTWELAEAAGETRLTLTCEVALPDDNALDNLAGWDVHLEFLAEWLDDGTRVDWPNWPRERWAAIHEHYEASMRPIS